MDKDVATLLDAVTFQVSDMMAPATVLEAAGRHLLDRLDLTDPHRWAVTSALGSIVAARKGLEAASEELLHVVAQDGADMLAVEVSKGKIVSTACALFKPMIYDDPDVCFGCGERQAAH
ncbi:hypothetical protein [Rhodococcus sp. I2R]|uniref:hypothetical protein n=1 Tax=Rhodococcus sp. I2R TaxID=2855445 RepID=UPI001E28E32C|nr:hypothetical protein [Rhodococcus sp. I2R]MCC8930816.1 hypothetical protein [Rhodococcus sp. I2R]